MGDEKMYGSIRRNYSTAIDTSNIEKKSKFSWFRKKNKMAKKCQEIDDLQETRYIKVDEVRKAQDVAMPKTITRADENSRNVINKNEFPVASVILTIVLTMMAMVLAFGGI
jgi:hypothetical protein